MKRLACSCWSSGWRHPGLPPPRLSGLCGAVAADCPWRNIAIINSLGGVTSRQAGPSISAGIGVNGRRRGTMIWRLRLLAQAGFKTFRIENRLGSVNWMRVASTTTTVCSSAAECRHYGIRPTMLLNAHRAYRPVKFFEAPTGGRCAQGHRSVTLTPARTWSSALRPSASSRLLGGRGAGDPRSMPRGRMPVSNRCPRI